MSGQLFRLQHLVDTVHGVSVGVKRNVRAYMPIRSTTTDTILSLTLLLQVSGRRAWPRYLHTGAGTLLKQDLGETHLMRQENKPQMGTTDRLRLRKHIGQSIMMATRRRDHQSRDLVA